MLIPQGSNKYKHCDVLPWTSDSKSLSDPATPPTRKSGRENMQNESVVGSDAIYALVASVRSPRLCAHVHFFRYAYGRARAAGGRASRRARERKEREVERRSRKERSLGWDRRKRGVRGKCGNPDVEIDWFQLYTIFCPHIWFRKKRLCCYISQVQILKCEQLKRWISRHRARQNVFSSRAYVVYWWPKEWTTSDTTISSNLQFVKSKIAQMNL